MRSNTVEKSDGLYNNDGNNTVVSHRNDRRNVKVLSCLQVLGVVMGRSRVGWGVRSSGGAAVAASSR